MRKKFVLRRIIVFAAAELLCNNFMMIMARGK